MSNLSFNQCNIHHDLIYETTCIVPLFEFSKDILIIFSSTDILIQYSEPTMDSTVFIAS